MSDEVKQTMTVMVLKEILNDKYRDNDIVTLIEGPNIQDLIAKTLRPNPKHWTCGNCKLLKSCKDDRKRWVCDVCFGAIGAECHM